jgi:hypothetical protein
MALPALWFTARKMKPDKVLLAFLGVLAAEFCVFGLFNIFWDPGFIKYWVFPLVLFWMGNAIVLNKIVMSSRLRRWIGLGSGTLLVTLVFAVNLIYVFIPESRPTANPLPVAAEALKQSDPNALFISPGAPLDFYIAFFTRRDIVSTNLIAYGSGNNLGKVKSVVAAHIQQHRQLNGPVYVYGIEALSPEKQNVFKGYLDGQNMTLKWTFADLKIYEINP